MTGRPFVDIDKAAETVARLLSGQPAVTGRQADSEQRERSRRPSRASTADVGASSAAAGTGRSRARRPAEATKGGGPTSAPPRAARAPRGGEAGAVVPAQLETSRTSFLEREQLGTKCTIGAVPPRSSGVQGLLDRLERQARTIRLETGRALEQQRDDDGGTETVEVFAEVLADDPRAHYFRRAVAAQLEPVWRARAAALLSCGEAGARCDCGDCGAPHVLAYRCGARACPTCARVASAVACERVARRAELAAKQTTADGTPMLEAWDGAGPAKKKAWRMLHLTTRAPATEAERYEPATLRTYVRAVRAAWGPFWRSTAWGRRVNDVTARGTATKRARRDTMFAMGLEVAPGGMVHIHAAVYGEFLESAEIAAAWKAACDFGGFVKLRLMRDRAGALLTDCTSDGFRDALREVLKYVTKGDKEPGVRAERAAAVEFALRNQRRVESGGAFRFAPKVTEADVATEQKSCEACGGAGSWTWRGMRAPQYVRKNGGFGLSHIVDDADALERAKADRLARLEAMHRARLEAAAVAHEYRPGGKFYGGSPPPWIDDPDEWETLEVSRL